MERAKIGLLLVKIEATYGLDPTPTAAANNIAVTRGEVAFDQVAEEIARDILDGGHGKVVGPSALPTASVKFRTELRGNRVSASGNDVSKGSASFPIEIDPLLQACDMPPTYVAESGGGIRDGFVTYQPVVPTSQAGIGPSVTFYLYSEGKLYKATGCKGNIVNIGLEAGKLGYIDWEFMGMYNAVTDSAIPASPVFLTTTPPQLVLAAAPGTAPNWVATSVTASAGTDRITKTAHGLFNGDRVKFGGSAVPSGLSAGTWYYVRDMATNDFKVSATLNGSAIDLTDAGTSVTMTSAPGLLWDTWTGPVFSRLNLKLGNAVVRREDGNSINAVAGFLITDRDSSADLDPESVTEATHPIWADFISGRSKPLRANIGTVSGNRIGIEVLTRLTGVKYEDRAGRRIQGCTLALRQALVGDTPGSEFKLLFQ